MFYVIQNLWKPWSVSAVSDLMGKKRRALVLSVDSLIQTTLAFLLAPLVGYVAHAVSIQAVFLGLGVLFLLVNNLLLGGGWGAPQPMLSPESSEPAVAGMELAEEGTPDGAPQERDAR